ncbi:hypothetical protein C0995_012703 [Termitomyces sp. Mi166|nr:hypothetical protein C0995_012703 [Termitomyces sp. Mi166\
MPVPVVSSSKHMPSVQSIAAVKAVSSPPMHGQLPRHALARGKGKEKAKVTEKDEDEENEVTRQQHLELKNFVVPMTFNDQQLVMLLLLSSEYLKRDVGLLSGAKISGRRKADSMLCNNHSFQGAHDPVAKPVAPAKTPVSTAVPASVLTSTPKVVVPIPVSATTTARPAAKIAPVQEQMPQDDGSNDNADNDNEDGMAMKMGLAMKVDKIEMGQVLLTRPERTSVSKLVCSEAHLPFLPTELQVPIQFHQNYSSIDCWHNHAHTQYEEVAKSLEDVRRCFELA